MRWSHTNRRLPMILVTVAIATVGTGRNAAAVATNPAEPFPGPQAAHPVGLEIHGKVVDIETGKPITQFALQRGSPDPNVPGGFRWGTGENWSPLRAGGELNYWYQEAGQWCRVLAAGYVPQPLTDKPYDGKPGTINVTIRLRRGWNLAGRVLDSSRKPVAGASVFLVGGRVMRPNITGGKAWHWPASLFQSEDTSLTRAVTNGDGRFLLRGVGGYETAIAVSAPLLDLWIHQPVPALGKSCEIVLPTPGKLVLRYRIEGGEPEATVSLSWLDENWEVAGNERQMKVPNGGRIVLDNLAPGLYRVMREKTVQVAGARKSLHLLRRDVDVEAGKTCEAAFVRETGAVVEGEILGMDELKLSGAVIYLVKPEYVDFIKAHHRVDEAIEILTCGATGRFKTPRLSPGTYAIVAEGYKPQPANRGIGLGVKRLRAASSRAFGGNVTVPERGPAPRIRIEMPRQETAR